MASIRQRKEEKRHWGQIDLEVPCTFDSLSLPSGSWNSGNPSEYCWTFWKSMLNLGFLGFTEPMDHKAKVSSLFSEAGRTGDCQSLWMGSRWIDLRNALSTWEVCWSCTTFSDSLWSTFPEGPSPHNFQKNVPKIKPAKEGFPGPGEQNYAVISMLALSQPLASLGVLRQHILNIHKNCQT